MRDKMLRSGFQIRERNARTLKKGTSVQNRNIGVDLAKTIFRACHIHDVCGAAARDVLYSAITPAVAQELARRYTPPHFTKDK